METISLFKGEYNYLSNFFPVKILWNNIEFPSVEHAYNASKSLSVAVQKKFLKLTAAEAKAHGRKVKLRKDWEDIKLGIMFDLLKIKFEHPSLRKKLLATGDAILIEGNTWGDTYWGVCEGVGLNILGKLLMRVRDECRTSE